MTPEALCTLAFAAIEDDATRPILADALEDLSWWNKRLESAAGARVGRYASADVLCAVLRGQVARSPVTAARSVAAVLIFRGWPRSWPLAAECQRKASLDETACLHGLVRHENESDAVLRSRITVAMLRALPQRP